MKERKIYILTFPRCKPDLLLQAHDEELVEEGDIVSGVVAVPDGQEDEHADLRVHAVVQELEALVDVVRHPGVRVDVERGDQLERKEGGLGGLMMAGKTVAIFNTSSTKRFHSTSVAEI